MLNCSLTQSSSFSQGKGDDEASVADPFADEFLAHNAVGTGDAFDLEGFASLAHHT